MPIKIVSIMLVGLFLSGCTTSVLPMGGGKYKIELRGYGTETLKEQFYEIAQQVCPHGFSVLSYGKKPEIGTTSQIVIVPYSPYGLWGHGGHRGHQDSSAALGVILLIFLVVIILLLPLILLVEVEAIIQCSPPSPDSSGIVLFFVLFAIIIVVGIWYLFLRRLGNEEQKE